MFHSRNLNHRINGFPKKARAARTAIPRGDVRTAATSKMEVFVIIVNGFQSLREDVVTMFHKIMNFTGII